MWEHINVGVLQCGSTSIYECINVGVLQRSLGVHQCMSTSMYEHINVGVSYINVLGVHQ